MLFVRRFQTPFLRSANILPFRFFSTVGGGSGENEGGDGGGDELAGNGLLVPSEEANVPERMPIGEDTPRPGQLLAIPIARRPVFPGFMAPLVVHDEALVQALTVLKSTSRPYVGLFLVNDPAVDLQTNKFVLRSPDQVYQVGVMAHVQQLETGPSGAIAMVMGHRRIRITGVSGRSPPPLIVRVEHLVQPPLGKEGQGDDIKALCNEILATLRDIIRINPVFHQHIAYFARKIDVTNPYALADFAASLTSLDAKDLQEVLETMSLQERLNKALVLLKRELQLSQLQQTIKQDVEKRIDKQQRQYFLQEQLKSIKKELGLERDDKEALVGKFNARVAKLALPVTAKAVYDEEIEKLSTLERNSSEFNVTRTYLDWITTLPWGNCSPDTFDIEGAKGILDEDHYGMQDVKDRILEFIAVGTLRGSVQGKILCFVGPPGVGKTSIGKSIARALGRKFFRFSVGGLSDVAEIKGHRRTYVGAMPGKFIQSLKSTGVSNPLVLIDEVDKISVGRGSNGDPSSALLELLDPNQNSTFMDHYLDTPYDASRVLFICTANTLDTIPGPLLDRMEVIRLSGYDAPEKLEIVRRYLDPKIRGEVGLESGRVGTPKSLKLDDSAVEHLIRWYARESGVRNLEKLVGKVYRKAAMKIVVAREKLKKEAGLSENIATAAVETGNPAEIADKGEISPFLYPLPSHTTPGIAENEANGAPDLPATPILVEDPEWTVTPENLKEYCGNPLYTSDRLYEVTPPGVAMGLAWTNMGGSSLYIEVASPYIRGGYGNAPSSKDENNQGALAGASGSGSDAPSTAQRFPSGGGLKLTGKMGEVMQESAQIAYTFVRGLLRSLPGEKENDFLDVTPLHMHVPEGATPKDGPSAGTCMTTALLSLALDL